MLRWAIGFLVLAIIAAALGLGGVASVATTAAQWLFLTFLVLLVLGLLMGRGRDVPA